MNRARYFLVFTLLGSSMACVAEDRESTSTAPQAQIAAQPVADALTALARQSGLQIIYGAEIVRGRVSNGAPAGLSPEEALARVLEGTGLSFEFLNARTVTITAATAKKPTARTERSRDGLRMARVDMMSSVGAGAVSGQETQQPQKSVEGGESRIEEITVTAQKRGAISVNDTPTSITAISSADIKLKGYVGLEDYLPSMPSISFVKTGIAFNNVIVRGITINTAGNSASNPLVSFYLGDTPVTDLTFGGAPDFKLADVERVELLRGPQGTLYGSGSMSGALRIIPAAPKLDAFEGNVEAGYSVTDNTDDANHDIQAVLNLPLVANKLALRVVGYEYENGGFFDNVAASDPTKLAAVALYGGPVFDRKIGRTTYTGYRVSALWAPLDSLHVTFGYLSQDRDVEGIPEMSASRGRFEQAKWGANLGTGAEISLTSMEVEYEGSKMSLVSSTSWAKSDAFLNWDVGRVLGPFFGGEDLPLIQNFPSTNVDAFSQEVRLFSHTSSRFQWLGGAYFRDADNRTERSTLPWIGDPAADPLGGAAWLDHHSSTSTREQALFGEVYFDLTHKLTATLGARYFEYKQSSSTESSGLLGTNTGPIATRNNGSGTIGKVNLSYKYDENKLFYAQFSQGFRLGQPHDTLPSVCDQNGDGIGDGTNLPIPKQIDSDTTDNWEIGSKLTLMNGRLQLNVAAFNIDWVDIPLSIRLPCALFVTLNAGTAESSGLEVEGNIALSSALRLNYAASYVNAELTSDIPSVGNDGDRIPGSPKYNAGLGLQYDFALLSREAFVRVDATYVGGYFAETTAAPPRMGAYTTVNLRGGARLAEGMSLDIFAQNITNEFALTGVYRTGSEANLTVITPRTIGVQMRYRF